MIQLHPCTNPSNVRTYSNNHNNIPPKKMRKQISTIISPFLFLFKSVGYGLFRREQFSFLDLEEDDQSSAEQEEEHQGGGCSLEVVGHHVVGIYSHEGKHQQSDIGTVFYFIWNENNQLLQGFLHFSLKIIKIQGCAKFDID